MFKSLTKDNSTFDYQIYGAMSRSSNKDIAGISLGNYDNDSKLTYKMAQIAVRDNYGDSSNNGMGNLYIRTNATGGTNTSNLTDHVCILYNGNVGINTVLPEYALHVVGDIYCTRLIAEEGTISASNASNVSNIGILLADINEKYVNVSDYTTCSKSVIQGVGLSNASFISNLVGGSNYGVRVFDFTNNSTLGQITLSNHEPAINVINIGSTDKMKRIIEFQVYGNVNVESLTYLILNR